MLQKVETYKMNRERSIIYSKSSFFSIFSTKCSISVMIWWYEKWRYSRKLMWTRQDRATRSIRWELPTVRDARTFFQFFKSFSPKFEFSKAKNYSWTDSQGRCSAESKPKEHEGPPSIVKKLGKERDQNMAAYTIASKWDNLKMIKSKLLPKFKKKSKF